MIGLLRIIEDGRPKIQIDSSTTLRKRKMIKLIKAIWKKIFGIKEEAISKVLSHCQAHSRFKKSCPSCQQTIQG